MSSFLPSSPTSFSASILLIDDDPGIRELIVDLLQQSGYHCLAVAEAETGLQLLGQHDWDLVISDVNLPGLSGLDVLASLRQHDADLPVLLITGFPGEVERGLVGAATAILIKPFAVTALLATARDMIDAYRPPARAYVRAC
jgi:two-component system response regulator FlrC